MSADTNRATRSESERRKAQPAEEWFNAVSLSINVWVTSGQSSWIEVGSSCRGRGRGIWYYCARESKIRCGRNLEGAGGVESPAEVGAEQAEGDEVHEI